MAIPVGVISWISGNGPKTLAIGAIGAVVTPPLTLGLVRRLDSSESRGFATAPPPQKSTPP